MDRTTDVDVTRMKLDLLCLYVTMDAEQRALVNELCNEILKERGEKDELKARIEQLEVSQNEKGEKSNTIAYHSKTARYTYYVKQVEIDGASKYQWWVQTDGAGSNFHSRNAGTMQSYDSWQEAVEGLCRYLGESFNDRDEWKMVLDFEERTQ